VGVSLDGRARRALDLLVVQYRQLAPRNSTFPQADDPEEAARLIAAIALAGDFCQWSDISGVYRGVEAFCSYLGVKHLSDLADAENEEMSSAVWVCLRAVPERKVSECASIIRRVARATIAIKSDFGVVSTWGEDRVREFVSRIIDEPVAGLFIIKVLLGGQASVISVPSGGAISLMSHLSLVDWTAGLLGGREAVRQEAIEVLEGLTTEEVLALFWWGFEGCPEACAICPAAGAAGIDTACDAILRGLV